MNTLEYLEAVREKTPIQETRYGPIRLVEQLKRIVI